jgi:dihydrofolate synthase
VSVPEPYTGRDACSLKVMDLSLERITAALRLLGDPQARFRVVHVAGTNGKGSVCAYLSSCLVQCGLVTGRFVSPYLVHPSDAVRINDAPVARSEWETAISAPECDGLSSFERWTVAAFVLFAAHGVEIAIVSSWHLRPANTHTTTTT